MYEVKDYDGYDIKEEMIAILLNIVTAGIFYRLNVVYKEISNITIFYCNSKSNIIAIKYLPKEIYYHFNLNYPD